jgi:hypothetical protein
LTRCAAIVMSAWLSMCDSISSLKSMPIEMIPAQDQVVLRLVGRRSWREACAPRPPSPGTSRSCRAYLLGGEHLDEAVGEQSQPVGSAPRGGLSEAELNCVRTKIFFSPAWRQLLIGMSISRYFPPIGTAGFDRMCVSGIEARPASAAENERQHVLHEGQV